MPEYSLRSGEETIPGANISGSVPGGSCPRYGPINGGIPVGELGTMSAVGRVVFVGSGAAAVEAAVSAGVAVSAMPVPAQALMRRMRPVNKMVSVFFVNMPGFPIRIMRRNELCA